MSPGRLGPTSAPLSEPLAQVPTPMHLKQQVWQTVRKAALYPVLSVETHVYTMIAYLCDRVCQNTARVRIDMS